MEQHQMRLLPVVEETGALLGLISEEHILEAWGEGPLQPVSEVMAGCGLPGELREEGRRREWWREAERGWGTQAHGS